MTNQTFPIVNEIKVEAQSPTAIADMFNLENLIKSHVETVEKLRVEIKLKNEMFKDTFNNNPTYHDHAEKVKEANKARLSVKSELSKQPSVAKLKQEITDLKFDYNEQKKTLSDLLLDYREQTKATQLDLFGGQIAEISLTAKLVRRK